jgi:hypothetical protein
MSHSVGIEIVVVGMAQLVAAVVECGLDYQQSRQKLQTEDGQSHDVDLVVRDGQGAVVGVQLDQKTQTARFVPQDCKGTKGKALAGQIAQRYAYSKVIAELKAKGYAIGKEEKQRDGTIKLVASRWS